MSSVKEYFSTLGSGFASLIKGLQVTGKEFITPKITERYPENRKTHEWPGRFRAKLDLLYDKDGNHKCIACGTCERVCPNGTITLETKMVDTLTGKKKKLVKYTYDLGSCTFCQLCVQNCPTGAIAFDNDFEQATFTRAALVKQLNYLPEKEEPAPTPEQIAKAQAEREAKIAAAKAAAAAKKAAAGAPATGAAPATAAAPTASIGATPATPAAAGAAAPAAAPKKKFADMTDEEKAEVIAKAKAIAAAKKAAAAKADQQPEK